MASKVQCEDCRLYGAALGCGGSCALRVHPATGWVEQPGVPFVPELDGPIDLPVLKGEMVLVNFDWFGGELVRYEVQPL